MTIEITGMAPLLQVYDIGTALQFYCDILGFRRFFGRFGIRLFCHRVCYLRHRITDFDQIVARA